MAREKKIQEQIIQSSDAPVHDLETENLATGGNYASVYTHHFKVTNGKVAYFRGIDDFPVKK